MVGGGATNLFHHLTNSAHTHIHTPLQHVFLQLGASTKGGVSTVQLTISMGWTDRAHHDPVELLCLLLPACSQWYEYIGSVVAVAFQVRKEGGRKGGRVGGTVCGTALILMCVSAAPFAVTTTVSLWRWLFRYGGREGGREGGLAAPFAGLP